MSHGIKKSEAVSPYLILNRVNDRKQRSLDRRIIVWRWAFLCALTALGTLLFMWVNGGLFLDFFYHPYRAGFVAVLYSITTIFLLIGSPFFFRRLPVLAGLAWLVAIFAVAWMLMPVF